MRYSRWLPRPCGCRWRGAGRRQREQRPSRRARAGETLATIDDVERRLDPDDLLIVDDSGPIGLAGVMGGASTEITTGGPRPDGAVADAGGTIDVVLEAAHFDPAVIARTARRHKLPSEASRRFERVVDPQLPPVAAERAARLLELLLDPDRPDPFFKNKNAKTKI